MTDESQVAKHRRATPRQAPGRARRQIMAGTYAVLTLALGGVAMWSSCDGGASLNLLRPLAQSAAPHAPEARGEAARVLMDERKYSEAAALLEPVVTSTSLDANGRDVTGAGNEELLLYAAAKLGEADLDIWSVIREILAAQDPADRAASGGGGLDKVFDAFSDAVLGTGAVRAAKVVALADALAWLSAAKEPDDRVNNTACLLAGILAGPMVADAKTALAAASAALNGVRSESSSACTGIGTFQTAMAAVDHASASFGLVLGAAKSCSALNSDDGAALLRSVEAKMATVKATADLGCSTLPACQDGASDCAGALPACVQEELGLGTGVGVAGDGKIEACELALHCTSGVCFD